MLDQTLDHDHDPMLLLPLPTEPLDLGAMMRTRHDAFAALLAAAELAAKVKARRTARLARFGG